MDRYQIDAQRSGRRWEGQQGNCLRPEFDWYSTKVNGSTPRRRGIFSNFRTYIKTYSSQRCWSFYCRPCIHSTFSKSPVWSCGPWINTTTTPPAYSWYLSAVLALQSWKPARYFEIIPLTAPVPCANRWTKSMQRLTEISHFECHVRVLRNRFCKLFSSVSILKFPFTNRMWLLLIQGDLFHPESLFVAMCLKYPIHHWLRYQATAFYFRVIVSSMRACLQVRPLQFWPAVNICLTSAFRWIRTGVQDSCHRCCSRSSQFESNVYPSQFSQAFPVLRNQNHSCKAPTWWRWRCSRSGYGNEDRIRYY